MAIFGGTNGNDNLPGTTDNDLFIASRGNDFLDGSGGNDTVSYAGWSGPLYVQLGLNGGFGSAVKYRLSLGGPPAFDSTDTLRSIENVIGSRFDDTIIGNEQSNILTGLGGRDTLIGGGGSDTVDYSASYAGVTVYLALGAGLGGHAEGDRYGSVENVIGSTYVDELVGNAERNRLQGMGDADHLEGLAGGDIIDGGVGNDTAGYYGSNAGVTVNLATNQNSGGHAAGDVLISIENLEGSFAYSDNLTGNNQANTLAGLGGADRLDGGRGSDTADYSHSPEALPDGNGSGDGLGVTVNLLTGEARGDDAEGDVLISIENVIGTGRPDVLTGNDQANALDGGEGNDNLRGGSGADTLHGGLGADSLSGATSELSEPDQAADVFVYESVQESVFSLVEYSDGQVFVDQNVSDIIGGFESGIDVLDLRSIDANALVDGNQNFVFADEFTGTAGELVIRDLGTFYLTPETPVSWSMVAADVDGDAQADFGIGMITASTAVITPFDILM